jgi:hypothetical protein
MSMFSGLTQNAMHSLFVAYTASDSTSRLSGSGPVAT